MSVNGVSPACNQKSNREPVLKLSERRCAGHAGYAGKKHLADARQSGSGQRVVKYEQRFCNSEFGQLKFTSGEVSWL